MRIATVTAALVALVLASCGVKSDLESPQMQVTKEQRRPDPSKPPVSLGDPGGTLPPYPTGP